jgi:hypothetical protein
MNEFAGIDGGRPSWAGMAFVVVLFGLIVTVIWVVDLIRSRRSP